MKYQMPLCPPFRKKKPMSLKEHQDAVARALLEEKAAAIEAEPAPPKVSRMKLEEEKRKWMQQFDIGRFDKLYKEEMIRQKRMRKQRDAMSASNGSEKKYTKPRRRKSLTTEVMFNGQARPDPTPARVIEKQQALKYQLDKFEKFYKMPNPVNEITVSEQSNR
jgi:hypothetical protein